MSEGMLSKLQNLAYPSYEDVQALLVPPPVPTGDELTAWKNRMEENLVEMANGGSTRYLAIIFSRELPGEEPFRVIVTDSHNDEALEEWYEENQMRIGKQNVPKYDMATLIDQDWTKALLQRYMDFWQMHSDVPVKMSTDKPVWGLEFDWTKKRRVE